MFAVLTEFQAIFSPPPEISMTQHALFPPTMDGRWTPLDKHMQGEAFTEAPSDDDVPCLSYKCTHTNCPVREIMKLFATKHNNVTLLHCCVSLETCCYACWHWQSIDGVYVCVAYSSEYKIINMETGHVQDLFSFDSGHVLPTITKISRVSFANTVVIAIIVALYFMLAVGLVWG